MGTKKRFTLLVVVLVLCLTACSLQDGAQPTPVQTQTTDSDLNSSDSVVVYIKNYRTNSAVIISESLIGESHYAEIPVNSNAKLLSPVRIDQENNLNFAYRAGDHFFVKLSPSGGIDQVVLPKLWGAQAVWLGNTLVFDSSGSDQLVMVNTEMQVDTAPPLSVGLEGNPLSGTLGVSGGKNPMVLWVAKAPILRPEGLFAYYRTFDPINKEIESHLVPIPEAKPGDVAATRPIIPDVRIGTIVLAIDPESETALLCSAINFDDPDDTAYQGAYLVVYNTTDARPITTEEACCAGLIIQFAGGYFLSDLYYEGCSYNWIRNLRDGSKVIALEELENDDEPIWNQIVSNGDDFIYINNKKAYYIDQLGSVTGEYPIDFEGFPNCWGSDECFGFSQPIYPQNEPVKP